MRVLLLIAVLLSGCATERAERSIAVFGPYCDKIGYERNTDKWRDCVTGQANAAMNRPIVQPR